MTVQKIQQSGRSFYLYMPTQWISDNKLIKGSEVNVNSSIKSLTISPQCLDIRTKSISLPMNSDNPEIIAEMVTHLFVAGYDEFELKFNNKLKKDSYDKLKKLMRTLGLNMIDLSDKSIKFYINISIDDIIKFGRDLVYKALNFTRMLLINEGNELLDEFITSFRYAILILLRSVNKYQLGQLQLNIKSYEIRFYNTLAIELKSILIHLRVLKNKNYISLVKKIFERLLILFDNPKLDGLIELKQMIFDLPSDEIIDEESYRKAKIKRDLIRLNYPMTINYLISLDEINQRVQASTS